MAVKRSGVGAVALVAVLVLAGCGDDGGGGDDGGTSASSPDEGEEAPEAAFGEPLAVDDLTVTVGEPYRYDWSPEVVRMDVAFETDEDTASTPDPTLECGGEEFEIDHDSANFAAEVSAGAPEEGEWAWSAGPDCTEGSLALGDGVLEFSEVADRE